MKPSNVHNFYGTTQALQRYFLYASDAMNLSPKCPLEVGINAQWSFAYCPQVLHYTFVVAQQVRKKVMF